MRLEKPWHEHDGEQESTLCLLALSELQSMLLESKNQTADTVLSLALDQLIVASTG